jgi:hypothetical protein
MDDTASLSTQFAVSVTNPIQIEAGYAKAPYSILEYPDVGMVSANGFRTQYSALSYAIVNSSASTVVNKDHTLNNSIYAEINKNSLGGMQFTTAIDTTSSLNASAFTVINRDLVLNNGIFTEINKDAFGRMQFLVSIDTVDTHNSEATVAINTSETLRNSVFTVINRSRSVRCQMYSQRITLDRTSTQYFYKSPFATAYHSDGYCTTPWPSTCWPYIDMFGWRASMQTFWVLSHRPALSTQFRVAIANKEVVNFQYTGLVVGKFTLPTSVTIPLWTSLERATPLLRSQFNITQGFYLNTEVRWRPF